MAKPGQISADKSRPRTFVNAATKEQVEEVRGRLQAIGLEFHAAGEAAGVSRPVRFALLRGEGSVGSLRKIETWMKGE